VLSATDSEPLRIALPISVLTDDTVERLKEILTAHPGSSAVLLHVGEKVLRLPAEFNVATRNGLMGELKMLLGVNALVATPGLGPSAAERRGA